MISYNDVLSRDPSEYVDHLDEFGFMNPHLIVKVEYDDGIEISFRVGNRSPLPDENWYYMLIDGEDGLFALDYGTM